MKPNVRQMPWALMWLAVACLGLPLSAQELKLRTTLKGHAFQVFSVAFSPDGKTLASGNHDPTINDKFASENNDATIKLWDVTTAKELATLKGRTSQFYGVAFSPDGKTLASAGDDTSITLWDVATRKERATLNGQRGRVLAISFRDCPIRGYFHKL